MTVTDPAGHVGRVGQLRRDRAGIVVPGVSAGPARSSSRCQQDIGRKRAAWLHAPGNGVRVDLTEPASVIAARQLAEEAAYVVARRVRRRSRALPIRPLAPMAR